MYLVTNDERTQFMCESSANEYQRAAAKTAFYPDAGEGTIYGLSYLALGLTGEAGEVADKIKKAIRDMKLEPSQKLSSLSEEWKQQLVKELGDVCWYPAQIATELGVDLEDILAGNIQKLHSRQERNTLHGSGDNR